VPKDPDNVSFAMPLQGVLPKMPALVPLLFRSASSVLISGKFSPCLGVSVVGVSALAERCAPAADYLA